MTEKKNVTNNEGETKRNQGHKQQSTEKSKDRIKLKTGGKQK
jgi:hypothetical protein